MSDRKRPFWYLRRRPDDLQADVDEELRVHLEMRIEELVAKGMSVKEARREALRLFGDLEYTRRYCRSQDERKEAGMRWNLLAKNSHRICGTASASWLDIVALRPSPS